jgi:hypothetical protein
VTAVQIAVLGAVLAAVGLGRLTLTDMLEEEARTRLGRLPYVLIRLARARVPLELRDDLAAEWEGELAFLLTGTEGLPVTRLARGISYSAGLVWSARAISDGLTLGTSGRERRIRAIRILAGCLVALWGAGGVATGIALLARGRTPIPVPVGIICMALNYVVSGAAFASARWSKPYGLPLSFLLACVSNIAFYAYQGDVARLAWAASWLAAFLLCVAVTLIARHTQIRSKQYEQLVQQHRTQFPDCPDCPLASSAG